MDYEKLSFIDSVKFLAENINFELEYEKSDSPHQVVAKKIDQNAFDNFEIINNWFVENLKKNRDATNYLLKRGLKKEIIQEFKLGFTGNSYDFLNFLKSKNINFKIAQEMGLIAIDENNRQYARFTNRIIFPIFNQHGKIIAFGGRTTVDHPAKYINSPQTKFFNKSKTLYGLNLAKKEIFKTGSLIIVEGYLDLIALNQAGFKNSVATLGTALTEEHLPLLKRENLKIYLLFDGDSAGIKALLKAVTLLVSINIQTKAIVIPNNLDPADLLFANKIDEFNNLVKNAEDGIIFTIGHILNSKNLHDPYERKQAFDESSKFLNELPPVLKESYSSLIFEKFGINLILETQSSFFIKDKNLAVVEQKQKKDHKNSKRLFSDAEYMILQSVIKDEKAREHFLNSTLIYTRYKKSKIPNLMKNREFDSDEVGKILATFPEYLQEIRGKKFQRELILFEILHLKKQNETFIKQCILKNNEQIELEIRKNIFEINRLRKELKELIL